MSFDFNADEWIAGMDEPAVEPPTADPVPEPAVDTSDWLAPMEQPALEAPAPGLEVDTSTWLDPMEQPAPETPPPAFETDTSTWVPAMEPAPEAPAPTFEIDTPAWLAPMEPAEPAAPTGDPDTSQWLAPMEAAPAAQPPHSEPDSAPVVEAQPMDVVDPSVWIDDVGTPQATLAPEVAAGLELSDDPVVRAELHSLLDHQNDLATRTTSPNPLIEAELAAERIREREGLHDV